MPAYVHACVCVCVFDVSVCLHVRAWLHGCRNVEISVLARVYRVTEWLFRGYKRVSCSCERYKNKARVNCSKQPVFCAKQQLEGREEEIEMVRQLCCVLTSFLL